MSSVEQAKIVIIPESVVEELGLNEDTEFDIEIVDDGIILNPKK